VQATLTSVASKTSKELKTKKQEPDLPKRPVSACFIRRSSQGKFSFPLSYESARIHEEIFDLQDLREHVRKMDKIKDPKN
jgi:hypothetical protein